MKHKQTNHFANLVEHEALALDVDAHEFHLAALQRFGVEEGPEILILLKIFPPTFRIEFRECCASRVHQCVP